jgi:transaldolase
MELFLDTANLDEIKEISTWGIAKGLTTNQKIFQREKGADFKDHVRKILGMIDGPVSLEVTESGIEGIIREAEEYSKWGKNVVIKVPMWADGKGLRIASALEKRGIKVNMTILMSSAQVMLAASVGTTYASLFYNRIKDAKEDPERVIRESRAIVDSMDTKTKIIVGSIRDPNDVVKAALAGADIVTVPYKMLVKMPFHQKTEETIKEFDSAWADFIAGQMKK